MSYFDWLCMYACPDGYKRSDYRRLLLALYDTEFYWTLNHDENRADDGLRLRDQYEDETGELCDETGPCSLFEMFLGLSIRCDNELMYDPDSGNQVGRWFWMMLENLQLDSFVDRNFDDGRFQWIVFHFMDRNYGESGQFCPFFVHGNVHRLERMELVYQLNYYLKWRFSGDFC